MSNLLNAGNFLKIKGFCELFTVADKNQGHKARESLEFLEIRLSKR